MATFSAETKIWEGPNSAYIFEHNTSIGKELLQKLSETPERVLNICHDDETSMTCHETKLASIRVAQNLQQLGYKKGDVFGFMCSNSTYLPAVLYGSLMIGAVVNPLDIGFKKDDIKHMYEITNPKLVLCDSNVYETVKLSLDEMQNKAKIITLRESISGVTFVDELLKSTGCEDLFE
jgi:acyl-coenzyme A synthetase/AMP-(fatty) acid ligase